MLLGSNWKADAAPCVIMSCGHANAQLFQVHKIVSTLLPNNPLFILTVPEEKKAYQALAKAKFLGRDVTVVTAPRGMKNADDFVSQSLELGGSVLKQPLIIKFDDDVFSVSTLELKPKGHGARKTTSEEFLHALQTMGEGLLKHGGFVAGFQTNSRNANLTRWYSTNLVTIMDVVHLRRRGPMCLYPSEMAMKPDWAMAGLSFQATGFNIRCEWISTASRHYNDGGLGRLTSKRKKAEAIANDAMCKLEVVSGIKRKDDGVTSINWKRLRGRVIWSHSEQTFVHNSREDEEEEDEDGSQSEDQDDDIHVRIGHAWLKAVRLPSEGREYTGQELLEAWQPFAKQKLNASGGRSNTVGSAAQKLCSSCRRLSDGVRYFFQK